MEQVVLVNENNEVLGTMPKTGVHGKETPLHRAFSAFLFNEEGKLLLQQRSSKKKTWPLIWSNSCCGHPSLNEENTEAVKRRAKEELGIEVTYIEEVSPYRYKFSKDGIMENEICPILVGFVSSEPQINKDEVEEIEWIEWEDYMRKIKQNPEQFSPWSVEEALILNENERFNELMKKYLQPSKLN